MTTASTSVSRAGAAVGKMKQALRDNGAEQWWVDQFAPDPRGQWFVDDDGLAWFRYVSELPGMESGWVSEEGSAVDSMREAVNG